MLRFSRWPLSVWLVLLLVPASRVGAQDSEAVEQSRFERWRERVYTSGTVELEWGVETRDGHGQKFELQILPEIEVELSSEIDLTLIPRLRADGLDRLEPGSPSHPALSETSRHAHIGDRVELELRELYIETELGDTYLTIGKQQVVWGKADGLKVLDVINPQDFREFILDDFEDSRIPLWTVNVEIPIGDLTLQLLWIPDQTYHNLAGPGAAYEITSVFPALPPGATVIRNEIDRPRRVIGDSDIGARLSAFWKGWDVTLNYFYFYEDIPVVFRTISAGPTITLSPKYKRSQLVGGTFSNAFGSLTLRGELGYLFNRFHTVDDVTDLDGVVETDEFAYVLGFDWFGFSDTLLSAQLFQNILTADPSGLLRDRVETNVSFLARRNFRNETIVTEMLWVHNLNDGDGFLRPKVAYELRDNVNVWCGLDLFYGTRNGLFGQFNERDRVLIGVEWGF
ncbi:MAG: hypothetical protein IIB38_04085 [Candidatus Hydrogenedentes bacterium]|nr:hypothetical protein [Candidatus Hydrogenedentota bacterium]